MAMLTGHRHAWLRKAGWLQAAALLIGASASGCGAAHPPPSPTAAFRPELVGIAADVTALDCGVSRIELASGDQVDVALAGSSLNYDTPCPGIASPTAWRAFGDNDADTAKNRLFFYGHDTQGAAWYGWAKPTEGCDGDTFGIGVGGWDVGDSYHLSTGVVLDKAADFRAADPPSSYVTADGAICVSAAGLVVSTWEPPVM